MSPSTTKAVLLVEDNPGDARLLREMLNEPGTLKTELTHVTCISEAKAHLAAHTVDIILLDLGLPDGFGLDAVRQVHGALPEVALVVLTGLDDESLALKALQAGAQDYLIKGQIESRGLLRALRYAIERKVMEEALFMEKERAQVTLRCIGEAVVCTDVFGRITFLNIVAEQLMGWSMQDAFGQPMRKVLRILNGKDGRVGEDHDGPFEISGGGDRPKSSILLRRDGTAIPIEDSVAAIHDRAGQSIGEVIVLRDVSAARAMSLQITHSAEHDFLTGLPNRMLLNDRLGQAIAFAERHNHRVAVLFLDLDGFKNINDSLGHPIGDSLLQSIAGRLVGCVRASDTVSRQGGDEFVVLLTELGQTEEAGVIARKILQTVAGAHTLGQHDLFVTASIGVSVYPDDGIDAETLIKNADTAMYQAKAKGRQSFQFFKPAMNIRAVERQSVEEQLRRAIDRRELALHYQPKVSLATGRITGAEALIRWTHPTWGAVSPAQFIHVAEDSGLILPIGAWVLGEACRQAREWLDAGLPPTPVAVNVSSIEFGGDGFLDGLFTALQESRLDPALLELELTESVLMQQAESTAGILQALRDAGIRVAIDDFGTGYSSLSYLQRFSVDTLKIDQSFISQIGKHGDDAPIVTAVIAMARSLKLSVVAEGVETLEQSEFLRLQLCDEAQGYYFCRPLPAEGFAALAATGLSRSSRVDRGAAMLGDERRAENTA
jgi:diguanylate cyclase (GGDEF)-like protein/PAS domain S-box-containing protein